MSCLRCHSDPKRLEDLEHFPVLPKLPEQFAEALAADGCIRAQQRIVPIDLVHAVRDQELFSVLRVVRHKRAQVGACHQRDVRTVTEHHQQVAVVGIGQRGVVVLREVFGLGVEVGEFVVVTTEERQALACEVGKVAAEVEFIQRRLLLDA